ncbi:MAG: hypothetical protein EA344_07605 [Alkalicoccus sp.]|nr:MAG: hypothetical protein EA344_07605 [Alkalicoccus sp.]
MKYIVHESTRLSIVMNGKTKLQISSTASRAEVKFPSIITTEFNLASGLKVSVCIPQAGLAFPT